MLGELSIFAGSFLGTLSLVLTSVFGGQTQALVSELLQPGEAAEVSVTQEASEAAPAAVVTKTVTQQAAPAATASVTPPPAGGEKAEVAAATTASAVELDEDCVSGEDLAVSANGQSVSVTVDGAEARVCASGEEGDSRVEANVESDSAD